MSPTVFCDVCRQELTDSSLKKHMELHFTNQDKKYECNVCEKIFYQEHALLSHSRMHKENKKQCKVCSKSFRWSVPKSHMLKHSDKKSLMCQPGWQKLRDRPSIRAFVAKSVLTRITRYWIHYFQLFSATSTVKMPVFMKNYKFCWQNCKKKRRLCCKNLQW